MSTETTYTIFDSDDREFTPVVTSNANIKKVCKILTECSFKSHRERVYYAQIGDLPAEEDESGDRVYTFKNIYESKAVAAAMIAQQLFYEFPTLIKLDGDNPVIQDQDQLDKMIRSEVWRAFEDWLGKFGENLFEVTAFLNTLATNPTLMTTVQMMSEVKNQGFENMTTSETPSSGSEDYSPETENGKK
ncbi:hypothetical protein [Gracilimonas tropica]|uniref:hypothetical protein n=1 Tax=Gracilimonas tropica TaxID=454600 RepID=UPI000380D16F|nr:hypothetical protein [Gracilimonas tropica]